MKNIKKCVLETPFEKNWDLWEKEYPRPQMRRNSFLPLCGSWDLYVKGDNEEFLGKICVPFAPESKLSGIGRGLDKGEKFIYKKAFSFPEGFLKDRVILHFGAVDQIARVFVNGSFVCEHVGGYTPFYSDVTDFITNGENSISVEVTDSLDSDIPYGKQSEKRGGMWYTPISGIWQSVWIESVPKNFIEKIKITTTLNSVTVETEGGEEEKKIAFKDKEINYRGNSVTIEIEDGKPWSVEEPYLYDFTISSGEDEVQSYFALRTVEVGKIDGQAVILFNGKPLFFHGLLDQGYFSDGIYTPGSPKGYENDILTAKRLGFNMLRKHIKIEPEIFYYYCDKLGMIVFQDMVNSGRYRYFLDTVLPTIRIKHGFVACPSAKRRAMFMKTIEDTVDMLFNHPSVCYWTVFNEGWGQFDADGLYDVCKKLDKTRIWDMTSGWYKGKKSDVDSEHVYFRKLKLKAKSERPLVLSEFGGYSFKIEENSFNLEKTYGYKMFNSRDEFEEALEKLYSDEVAGCIENGLCASVMTQLSDVEDETNGLMTYDRQKVKVDEEKMLKIAKGLFEAFEKRWKNEKGADKN